MNTPVARSSARLRGKQQETMQVAEPTTRDRRRSPPVQSSSDVASGSSPSKRRKIGNESKVNEFHPHRVSRPDNRVKGRRGHLKLMTEMPMDVLYEILNSLEPIDLLYLSWANKSLHSIVMGKSARYLWERAFEALYASTSPPPTCPSDLNLAQYTRLLFEKRCMECNSPHGSHVIWPHRLRVCGKCLEGSRFVVLTSPYPYWQVTIPMLRTFVNGRYQTYVLASEFNEINAKMASMILDSDEQRDYIKQRDEWVYSRRQDEWKFASWQREQKRDRKNELEEIRIKRRDTIVDRLAQLGWGEELGHLNKHQLWTLPGIRVAKPLTDKAWVSLCPELIDHLEAVRQLRLEQEKMDRITSRCEDLSRKMITCKFETNMFPQILDVAISEPFKSFILIDSEEQPPFMTNEADFINTLNNFTAEWNESRDEFLSSLLPTSEKPAKLNSKGKGKAVSNTEALSLATVFFQCPSCVEPIAYPRILVHDCLFSASTQANKRDDDPEHLTMLSNGLYSRPWFCDAQDLSFDLEASEIAKMIVQVCGANPDEATAETMDSLDRRLECLRCSGPKKGRLVMQWRMAIVHELEKHSASSSTTSPRRGRKKAKQPLDEAKWGIVDDEEDLTWIRTKERYNMAEKQTLVCRRCRSSILSGLSNMQEHWRSSHRYPEKHLFHHPFESASLDEKVPMLEGLELREMFVPELDQSIRNSHIVVKIPTRKVEEDL